MFALDMQMWNLSCLTFAFQTDQTTKSAWINFPQQPHENLSTSKTPVRFLINYSKLHTQQPDKRLVTLKALDRLLAPMKSSGCWGSLL